MFSYELYDFQRKMLQRIFKDGIVSLPNLMDLENPIPLGQYNLCTNSLTQMLFFFYMAHSGFGQVDQIFITHVFKFI